MVKNKNTGVVKKVTDSDRKKAKELRKKAEKAEKAEKAAQEDGRKRAQSKKSASRSSETQTPRDPVPQSGTGGESASLFGGHSAGAHSAPGRGAAAARAAAAAPPPAGKPRGKKGAGPSGGVAKPAPGRRAAAGGGGAARRRAPVRRRGRGVLREIRLLQRTGALLSSKAPFRRIVRDAADACGRPRGGAGFRFTLHALGCLQEAAEAYVTGLLEAANLCTTHARRRTLMKCDLTLARRLRGEDEDGPGRHR